MENEVISSIREFNRFYTAILGVVNNHILESEYSITEARIIYELANCNGVTAREIKEKLHIDEGYMSRIISGFVKNGILQKKQSENDKRVYMLELTLKGRKIYNLINQRSDKQIENLIEHLNGTEQKKLLALIAQVKSMLTKSKMDSK